MAVRQLYTDGQPADRCNGLILRPLDDHLSCAPVKESGAERIVNSVLQAFVWVDWRESG